MILCRLFISYHNNFPVILNDKYMIIRFIHLQLEQHRTALNCISEFIGKQSIMVKTCLTAKPIMIQTINTITNSVIHRFRIATSLLYETLKHLLDSRRSLQFLISLILSTLPDH